MDIFTFLSKAVVHLITNEESSREKRQRENAEIEKINQSNLEKFEKKYLRNLISDNEIIEETLKGIKSEHYLGHKYPFEGLNEACKNWLNKNLFSDEKIISNLIINQSKNSNEEIKIKGGYVKNWLKDQFNNETLLADTIININVGVTNEEMLKDYKFYDRLNNKGKYDSEIKEILLNKKRDTDTREDLRNWLNKSLISDEATLSKAIIFVSKHEAKEINLIKNYLSDTKDTNNLENFISRLNDYNNERADYNRFLNSKNPSEIIILIERKNSKEGRDQSRF